MSSNILQSTGQSSATKNERAQKSIMPRLRNSDVNRFFFHSKSHPGHVQSLFSVEMLKGKDLKKTWKAREEWQQFFYSNFIVSLQMYYRHQ